MLGMDKNKNKQKKKKKKKQSLITQTVLETRSASTRGAASLSSPSEYTSVNTLSILRLFGCRTPTQSLSIRSARPDPPAHDDTPSAPSAPSAPSVPSASDIGAARWSPRSKNATAVATPASRRAISAPRTLASSRPAAEARTGANAASSAVASSAGVPSQPLGARSSGSSCFFFFFFRFFFVVFFCRMRSFEDKKKKAERDPRPQTYQFKIEIPSSTII
jgi:hypothetical protein